MKMKRLSFLPIATSYVWAVNDVIVSRPINVQSGTFQQPSVLYHCHFLRRLFIAENVATNVANVGKRCEFLTGFNWSTNSCPVHIVDCRLVVVMG
jgi:hypothetical protein